MTRWILILEDNEERISAFEQSVALLGDNFRLKVWRNAPSFIAECEDFFQEAVLISLDHDLNPTPRVTIDPGSGMDVARFLADFLPCCPVLIHSSNTDRAWSMHNELRYSGWSVDCISPIGSDWIGTTWISLVGRMIQDKANTWRADLPADHLIRMDRVRLSLCGLGLGDALGELLNTCPHTAQKRLKAQELPSGPWIHTDDTEMAISIAVILKSHGRIDQDGLAKRFARRFERDPDRGYGRMTRIQLREAIAGGDWRQLAASAFGGLGSLGNGGAMRVAPLGAYFSDDIERCVDEARLSALVTHTHPEGVAGTIAVAVAAAASSTYRTQKTAGRSQTLFDVVLRHTPESSVRRKLVLASEMGRETPLAVGAKLLGNGSQVTAADTVPFCVWVAAHHGDSFIDAIGTAISAGGDCDTNAAIVGGIVALSSGWAGIPEVWIEAREPVQF